jgi:ubiquinone/menaquinone biosynthesis C-methylase UbiE
MSDKWSTFHASKFKTNYPSWPVEAMVKVFFGDYLSQKVVIKEGMKILDIGCGFGNNLLPFYFKGLKCCGIEVTQEVVDVTKSALEAKGIHDIEVKVGSNRNIPYDDNTFDFIIANNVIHYEPSEKDLCAGLNEYARVLKKGGGCFIMTVAPEHEIFKRSKVVDVNVHEIANYDFRNGEKYFYFGNEKYFQYFLEKNFQNIELGRVTERLMTHTVDFYLAYCTK